MAEIYRRPQGVKSKGRDPLNYVVAHHVETATELELHADLITARAKAVLDSAEERTGQSQITHEEGAVDHYIVLSDPQAMAIEFSNKRRKAVSPLRRAVRML